MSLEKEPKRLRQLAFLYLTMARRTSDYLSDDELETLTTMLQNQSGGAGRSEVQGVLMRALNDYTSTGEESTEARVIAEVLADHLTIEQRQVILEDLRELAEADGVVHKNEQGMLQALAKTWGIEKDPRRPQSENASWGVLHHLAYIFLVLAHSTDNDLSDTELQVMYNKLREWEPTVSPDDVERVLEEAMSAYSKGRDADRLETAIRSVRDKLPRKQRMAALNDLVKIANADGVFLDDEEDLINHLLSEWDVDPYANYGQHGNKSSE